VESALSRGPDHGARRPRIPAVEAPPPVTPPLRPALPSRYSPHVALIVVRSKLRASRACTTCDCVDRGGKRRDLLRACREAVLRLDTRPHVRGAGRAPVTSTACLASSCRSARASAPSAVPGRDLRQCRFSDSVTTPPGRAFAVTGWDRSGCRTRACWAQGRRSAPRPWLGNGGRWFVRGTRDEVSQSVTTRPLVPGCAADSPAGDH
jgi:hypothetical protein